MEAIAVCHVHSNWSYDGRWSLKDLAHLFASRSVRIVLMSEHDLGFSASRFEEYRVACAEASSNRVLIVPGMEYSDNANRVHVLVWGTHFLGEGLATTEMLRAVQDANGVAVLAHPTRKAVWQEFDPHWAEYLLGVEVWNRKYDGWCESKTAPSLIAQSGLLTFVGLDFHTKKQLFPLRMALELDEISEEETLKCLRERRCSAQILGFPVKHRIVRASMPALGAAEAGRKRIASLAKRKRKSAS